MLYDLIELQRAALRPLVAWLRLTGDQLGLPPAAALAAWLGRSLAIGDIAERPIEAAVASSIGRPVPATELLATPFVRIVRLGSRGGPANVLVTPHSGFAAAVLHRVAATMLEAADVIVTEWVDARLVPLAAGRLGLAEQGALTAAALEAAGLGAAVVALSQGGIPALRALGTTPGSANGKPRRLCLIGAPIDPRIDAAPAQRLITGLPERLVAQHLLLTVPTGYPGAGRRVFAAFLQLMAVAGTTPSQVAEIQGGLLLELLGLVRMGYDRQHEDLHALVDVPAELFTEMLHFLRATDDAVLDATLGLRPGIGPLALLTIEAAGDALVGPGQTHAAVNRLRQHVVHHERLSLPQATHQDLFIGQRFERTVRPCLLRFLA